MNKRKRIATVAGLWALAEIGAVWPTAEAIPAVPPSICSRLAAQMRRSPALVVKDQTVPKMLPWIVSALPRQAEQEAAYRFLAPKWRLPLPPTIESLPGTDLFMASTILGSGDCLSAMFFEWKRGRPLRLLGWPPISSGACSRQGVWGGLAMVLGQPAYIEYGSLNPNNMDALVAIAPWEGKNWGRPCPVSIRFTYGYDVRQLYCGAANRVCNAADKVAAEVKRRYHAYSVSFIQAFNSGVPFPKFHFHGVLSKKDRILVTRARQIGMPKHIVPVSDANPAWLQHFHPYGSEYFPLTLDGTRYVGVATRSANPRTAYLRHHWLFILFQAPSSSSRRLVALAVFTVHRRTSGVESTQAADAFALPSDSVRIPVR
jgi:hypothetical protein